MMESIRELPIIGPLLSRPILAAVVVVILVIAAIGIASVSDYSTEGAGEGAGPTAQWLTVMGLALALGGGSVLVLVWLSRRQRDPLLR